MLPICNFGHITAKILMILEFQGGLPNSFPQKSSLYNCDRPNLLTMFVFSVIKNLRLQ